MKKSTLIVGIVSSFLLLIGVVFKTLHWPGAGVIMTLGATFFALCYSLLLYLDKNKIADNSYQKFVNLITMLTMLIITAGFLFKMMHWPGAGIGIYAGHALLVIMIPILFVQASREKDPVKKLNFYNIAIFLVVLTAFSYFVWKMVSKQQ